MDIEKDVVDVKDDYSGLGISWELKVQNKEGMRWITERRNRNGWPTGKSIDGLWISMEPLWLQNEDGNGE